MPNFSSMTTEMLISALHSGLCTVEAGGGGKRGLWEVSDVTSEVRLRSYWRKGARALAGRSDCSDGKFISTLLRALPYAYDKVREAVDDNAYYVMASTVRVTRPDAAALLDKTWPDWCKLVRGGFGPAYSRWCNTGAHLTSLKQRRPHETQALATLCWAVSPKVDASTLRAGCADTNHTLV